MKQDLENQYDDDLTIGTDEYDDSYYTDADDLFDFSTSNESPISRLKSLVLSIDWEITDEVLLQFNEELIDLKGIWAGNSVNLIYVQALEKLSKYIYQNKASSHPNAIKLLLTFYYNLEKIVSSEDLTEAEKKETLLEDVKRFEALKRQISQKTVSPEEPPPIPRQPASAKKKAAPEDPLLNLKAIVLGIDWEITDQELNDLRKEVIRLEEVFAGSRPKLILLQGIGALGAYIKTKKSNAHADAFKVLHLFYESLEKIVKSPMSLDEEKAILFPAVEKFNDFKALLGPTISPEAISREKEEGEEDEEDEEDGFGEDDDTGELRPALSDVAYEESMGFQADEEAKALGIDNPEGVSSHIDDFFGENILTTQGGEEGAEAGELLSEEGAFQGGAASPSVDRDIALQGVDVEADDEEEDEEDYKPGVAALSDTDEDAVSEWRDEPAEAKAVSREGETPSLTVAEEEVARAADSFFSEEEALPAKELGGVDRATALQGVDVETEADEDSDEASLPMEGEEVAPALLASEEESLFSAETLASTAEGLGDEITGTLDGLFLEDEEIADFTAEQHAEDGAVAADVERKEPEVLEQEAAESIGWEQTSLPEQVGDTATERQPETETEAAKEDEGSVTVREDEDLDLFFADGDLEQSADVDSLFESLEPALLDESEKGTEEATLSEVQSEGPESQVHALESSSVESEDVSISFGEETPETEETAFEADEVSPEEELAFDETEPLADEPDLSIPDETAEEEISFADESLAEEDMIAMEEEISTVEDEISPIEEVSPVANDSSPVEEELAVPVDEKVFFAGEENEILSLKEDVPRAEGTVQDEEADEEVVFELADEPAEEEPVQVIPESIVPAPEETGLAFPEEEAEDLSPAFAESARVEDAAFEEDVEAAIAGETGAMVGDNRLAGLQACIASLGLELNDTILNGVYQEINGLRQKWSSRPLEKTFLQLLSTITQHIDRYRFEASAEAHNLMLSVFNALAAMREDDSHYNQELLLAETLKVVEWQQEMLTRQAVQKGPQLTFAAPVRTEGEEVESAKDARMEFDQELQQYEESEEMEVSVEEPSEADVEQSSDSGKESITAELKQEIASLRQTLQKEIAELRSELKGR